MKVGELISIQEYHEKYEGQAYVWKGDVYYNSQGLLNASGSVFVRLVLEI